MERTETQASLELIQELIEALQDPSAPMRFSAAQSLGEHGEESAPAVGALLKKALQDPDSTVRVEAAMALYKIGHRPNDIVPLLIRALQAPDEARSWVAADCLGEIGPDAREAIPALKAALDRDYKNKFILKGISLALEKISAGK